MSTKIKLITASAGSGKTHKLQDTLSQLVDPSNPKKIRPEAVIATTFTKKAAQELKERARKGLIEKGFFDEAIRIEGALISTVHSVCTKIIEIFSYESGLSPKLEVLPQDDQSLYFNSALSKVLSDEVAQKMYDLETRIIYSDGRKHHDWRNDVNEIIEKARSNGINPEGIRASFDFSWKSIKSCMGTPIDGDEFEKKVLGDGVALLQTLKGLPKLGEADKKFIERLSNFLRNLKDNRNNLRWDDWQGVAGAALGKITGESYATAFKGLIGDYPRHPRFQEDYRQYLEMIFNLSAEALDAYQNYKQDRGLIDFTDMECQVLALLDKKEVKQRLSEEFDLLMVDEFQDTSPMQLAIFLKLSEIIPQAIWVGDQKQSIYGFRGADPSLMDALLDKMKTNLDIETLGNSWRSRPDLVKHANELFAKAFESTMPPEQIMLKSVRKERDEFKEAIEVWRIEKSDRQHNKIKSLRAIAQQIKFIYESKRQVAYKKDQDQEQLRDIELKDIAILCRTNDDCVATAGYLKEIGLPASVEQDGLLSLPESKLMLSALRYYAFPFDSLAIMEIKLLVDSKDNVEELIEERLRFVADQKEYEYGKDHWFIQRIDEIRQHHLNLSPSEVVNQILIKLELQRVISGWGDGQERWSNISLFRDKALVYEQSCQRLKAGATLGGFMLWLKQREKNKLLKYGGKSENAITVMTWHASKGLEWPLVVLNDCISDVRTDCFGCKVISLDNEIDLANPLKGRLIRFWFKPFQPNRTNVPFVERLHATEEAKLHAGEKIREAARLLYVGFTRARDYLCFPMDGTKEACIFTEVLGSTTMDLPTVEGHQRLPWTNEAPQVLVKKFNDVSGDPILAPDPTEVYVPIAALGVKDFEPYLLNPSSQIKLDGAVASLFGSYGSRLSVKARIDDDLLGDCLHDIAALTDLTKNDVERVLQNYNLSTVLDAEEVLAQMNAYEKFLASKGISDLRKELPITGRVKGQMITGIIDQLGTHEDHYVLIDHKSYQGTSLEEKALSFSGQLGLYKQVLEIDGQKVRKVLIHFITQGLIYQIE
jgi:ATP-dependent helicase/nuclease subunit A